MCILSMPSEACQAERNPAKQADLEIQLYAIALASFGKDGEITQREVIALAQARERLGLGESDVAVSHTLQENR